MIKLVSLNIERSKHLDLVLPFIERERPDVLCIQELMEHDIQKFSDRMKAPCIYAPMTNFPGPDTEGVEGVGIFCANVVAHRIDYYGGPEEFPTYDTSSLSAREDTCKHALVSCDVESGGETYRIATTHFTWSPDPTPTPRQVEDMKLLLEKLAGLGSVAACGDFNAPRGYGLWEELSSRYKDNIPSSYISSVDAQLHRAGPLNVVVDGLFSTPEYIVSDVQLHSGVSDHLAITATVEKGAFSHKVQ